MLDLYSSTPHKVISETLTRLNGRETSDIPTEDIVQMAKFFLKISFLSLMSSLKDKNQVTAIHTKLSPH